MKYLKLITFALLVFSSSACLRKIDPIKQRYLISAVVYSIPTHDINGDYWGTNADTFPDLQVFLERIGDTPYSGRFYSTNQQWNIENFPIRLTFAEPQPINDSVYNIVIHEIDAPGRNIFPSVFFEGLDYSNGDYIHIENEKGEIMIILDCEDRIIDE